MLFEADITIPKETTEASPTIVNLGVSQGVITKFMIRPRAGHAKLAHCVIQYHDHPIAPTTTGMDLHGDAAPIDWEDYIEIQEPPFVLKVIGWNDDDTYPHTFNIIVVILPKYRLLGEIISKAITGIFRGLLGTRRDTGGS